MSSTGSQFAIQLLSALPTYVVYVVCIVLALRYWNHVRLVAVLALSAAVWLLLASFAMIALRAWMIDRMSSGSGSSTDMGNALGMLGLLGSLAHAGGLALLVAAVFLGRRRPVPTAGRAEG
jgi:hypothetical protein